MTPHQSPADDPEIFSPTQNQGGDLRHDPFVFRDQEGKRWPRLRLALLAVGTLAFVAFVLFAQSLLVTPLLQRPDSLQAMQAKLKELQFQDGQARVSKPTWLKFSKPAAPGARYCCCTTPAATAATLWRPCPPLSTTSRPAAMPSSPWAPSSASPPRC